MQETEQWASAAGERALTAHLQGYVATARANLAWIALQSGDCAEAERLAREALALWQSPSAYPFEWLARWPLVAVLMGRGDLSAAMEQAEALLLDHQQTPPPAVGSPLALAADAWRAGDADKARENLLAALSAGRDGWQTCAAAIVPGRAGDQAAPG